MDGIRMPSIRKSSSFRSRIPVRRAKVPHQRRCHSPPINALTNSASVSAIRFPGLLKKKGSKKQLKNKSTRDNRQRYSTSSSSSSYSSSDESANSQDVHFHNNSNKVRLDPSQ